MATRRHDAASAEQEAAPARTVRQRAAQVIDQQREKVFAHVAAAVDGRDPEGVHDMRVATRRLRACLKTFAPWLDEADHARVAPAVRDLTRALGKVRELDVLRLRLAGLTAGAPPERALALEHVDAHLARQRRRARERMMARFAKVGLDRLDGRLRRLSSHLEKGATPDDSGSLDAVDAAATPANGERGPGSVAHDQPVTALLGAIAGTLLGEAHQICHPTLPERAGTPQGAEALHGVRITAKKLRYQLEIVAPYLGVHGEDAVKRLKALQDKLGDFHDDTVLDDTLRTEIDRAGERERPLLAAEMRRFRSARRRVLTREERAVRAALARLREQGFVALVVQALEHAGVAAQAPSAGNGAAGDEPPHGAHAAAASVGALSS